MLNDPKKAGRARGCCTFPFAPAPGVARGSLWWLGAPLFPVARLGPAGGGRHPWVHGGVWDWGSSQSWSICPGAGRSQPPSSAVGEAACVPGETHGDTARPRPRGTWLSKHPVLGAGSALSWHGGDIGQSCPRTHSNGAPGWPRSRQPHSTWPLGRHHLMGMAPSEASPPQGASSPKRHHRCMGQCHPVGHCHPKGHLYSKRHHHCVGHRHPTRHRHPLGHRHPGRHHHPTGHHHSVCQPPCSCCQPLCLSCLLCLLGDRIAFWLFCLLGDRNPFCLLGDMGIFWLLGDKTAFTCLGTGSLSTYSGTRLFLPA